MSLLTGAYGHVGRHIIHVEEGNRSRNNVMAYDSSILSIVGEAPGIVHKNTVDTRTQN